MTPLALNVREAAKAAGIGRTRLREEISAGRLLARKAGRRTVVETMEIRRWLAFLNTVRTERFAEVWL
jgi:hypothetical protein